ncbi:MAG TPA: DUF1552 domain-containing protein [Sphingobium sp.]|uniref:DUF1552 domain-containing protein n=1 Tax=Sphingobium sp. TaxID=1912891 RepID=UPI002ED4B188
MQDVTRRRILRGLCQGAAVSVSLPLLDFYLDNNGEALAAGLPIPNRFGTWFWGCGINASRWFPDRPGKDFDIKAELVPLTPYKDKLTIFSGFNCVLGGKPNLPHWSGIMATMTGTVPAKGGMDGGIADAPTLDCLIADAIGQRTRFRSLEVACTGKPEVSYSMRAGSTVNPSEVDPVSLYRRLFTAGFRDPNAIQSKPDPSVMLHQSVLSSIKDDRDKLMRTVGASDRARMDQYFTSLRQTEQQLALQMEKPAPLEACLLPPEPGATKPGPLWDDALATHNLLGELVVMALSCNQTRVFNVALSGAASNLRRPGDATAFHEFTHEEPVDQKLGYQVNSTFFMEKSMEAFSNMLRLMDNVKEGNGTLLDHSLVLATSESSFAKIHSIDNLPIIVAGSCGGKWSSGQHIAGKGDPTSRVGLTIQQALGMSVADWGTDAMRTANPISEVL